MPITVLVGGDFWFCEQFGSKQAAIDEILQSLADWPVEVSSEWRTDSRVPKRGAAFLHL